MIMDRLLQRFETVLDPFEDDGEDREDARLNRTGHLDPLPAETNRFIWHFAKQAKWPLLALLVLGGLSGGVEAAMYTGVGWLIDALERSTPQTLIADHFWLIAGLAFLTLIGRALVLFLSSVLEEQVISPELLQPHPLAELSPADGPGLHLLPERLRRPARAEGPAGRPGDRRPDNDDPADLLVLRHLHHPHRHHPRRDRLAHVGRARPVDARLCLDHPQPPAEDPRERPGDGGGALGRLRPRRRQLHQHPLGQAVRFDPPRGHLRQGRIPVSRRRHPPDDAGADRGAHRGRRPQRLHDDRRRRDRDPRLAGRPCLLRRGGDRARPGPAPQPDVRLDDVQHQRARAQLRHHPGRRRHRHARCRR